MQCPNCGYCDNKTTRITKVTPKNKEKFIRKYLQRIELLGIDTNLLRTARQELGYSDKTINGDIRSSLMNEYSKTISRLPREVGQK